MDELTKLLVLAGAAWFILIAALVWFNYRYHLRTPTPHPEDSVLKP